MRKFLVLPPIEIPFDYTVHRVNGVELCYGSADDKTNEAPALVGVSTFQIVTEQEVTRDES